MFERIINSEDAEEFVSQFVDLYQDIEQDLSLGVEFLRIESCFENKKVRVLKEEDTYSYKKAKEAECLALVEKEKTERFRKIILRKIHENQELIKRKKYEELLKAKLHEQDIKRRRFVQDILVAIQKGFNNQ